MLVRSFIQLSASILVHSSLVGVIFAFSASGSQNTEQAFRVSLAEFSAPAAQSAPVVAAEEHETPPEQPPQPEPPEPEPIVEKVEPQPIPKEPPQEKTKKVSPKKSAEKPKPAEKKQQAPSPPPTPVVASSGANAPGGGSMLNMGGIAAHDVDSVDQKPSITRRVMPEYPQKARRMNVEGRVDVRILVDSSGKAKECKVHSARPEGYFEDAALAAARKTRFIPGKIKGQPVNTIVLVPFLFVLR